SRRKFIAGLACNALSRDLERSYVQISQEFLAGLPCNELSRELRRSYVQIGQEFLAGLVTGGCNAIHFSPASRKKKRKQWSKHLPRARRSLTPQEAVAVEADTHALIPQVAEIVSQVSEAELDRTLDEPCTFLAETVFQQSAERAIHDLFAAVLDGVGGAVA